MQVEIPRDTIKKKRKAIDKVLKTIMTQIRKITTPALTNIRSEDQKFAILSILDSYHIFPGVKRFHNKDKEEYTFDFHQMFEEWPIAAKNGSRQGYRLSSHDCCVILKKPPRGPKQVRCIKCKKYEKSFVRHSRYHAKPNSQVYFFSIYVIF